MRIAINGFYWDQPYTGSGQYLRRLWKALPELPESAGHTFVLLRPPTGRGGNLAKVWWEQVGLPLAARRAGADVLHCPYLAAPLLAGCPVVVTVHDLIPWVLPAYRASRTVRLYLALARAACRRAALVLADSEASRRDVLRYFGLPPDSVRTVLLGIEPEFGAPVPPGEIAEMRRRFGLPDAYAFYIGGFDERKDVPVLLRAWAAALPDLARAGEAQPVLAIAGKLPEPGGIYPDLPALAQSLRLLDGGPSPAPVRFLGRVTELDKRLLLAGAQVFAFPSRYEGFGYDPLEAMAAGTPLLCSAASSLPEIVGDGGILLPPGDVPAWTAALVHLWHDPALRAKLSALGRAQAARLRPETTAAQTLQAYEWSVVGGRWSDEILRCAQNDSGGCAQNDSGESEQNSKLKTRVLWIWHAAVVAEYQKPVEALARDGRWEMHLLVPTAWPERAGQMVRLERRSAPDYAIHAGRVLFPHHYYAYFFPGLLGYLLRIRPGVLHVYEEAHSLLPFLVLLLRPLLERLWGRRVPVVLYAAQNIVKRYPPPFRWFEAYCFRRADAILPCGELVAATLRQKGYRGPLRVVPLPTDPAAFERDKTAGDALRRSLGICADAVVIGYAGKLVAEKGVETLLRAFLCLPAGPRAPHLMLAGDGPLRAVLEAGAEAAGAEERVHLLGALPHGPLVAALSAGNIWVVPSETRENWREQFGRAAVEAMACGNAVVASDSGELPRVVDEAGRIFPEGDADALRGVLAELIADSEARSMLGEAGRGRVLAHYTPEQAAELYSEVYASFQPSAFSN